MRFFSFLSLSLFSAISSSNSLRNSLLVSRISIYARSMLIPIIQINTSRRDELDVFTTLQKIYYQPAGYQRNAKKLLEVSLNDGYDFTIDEVNWLERQAVHQIYKPHPK